MKEQHPVIAQIEKADKSIVAEDFDTLLNIYTDDAILVVEPGRNAIGKVAIKKAFKAIAVFFKNGLQVSQPYRCINFRVQDLLERYFQGRAQIFLTGA